MGDLLLQGIDDALEHQLHESARRNGRSLSDEAKDILQKELIGANDSTAPAILSAWDALRSTLVADDPDEAAIYTQIMSEIEAERKKDFGRPPEVLE